jgi:hypothetical protein
MSAKAASSSTRPKTPSSASTRPKTPSSRPKTPSSPSGHGRSSVFAEPRAANQPFTLDAPPPFFLRAEILLRQTVAGLPAKLRPSSAQFEADLLSRESCLLTVHTFWYTYCAILFHEQTAIEQTALLRLMSQARTRHPDAVSRRYILALSSSARGSAARSLPRSERSTPRPCQEMARLTTRRRRKIDSSFFDNLAPVVALTVLVSLVQHANLKMTLSYIHSVVTHLVVLLGGRPAQPRLEDWLAHASVAGRPAPPPSSPNQRRPSHRSKLGTSEPAPPPPADTAVRLAPPLAGFNLPPLLRYSVVEEEFEFAHAELKTVHRL